MNSNSFNIQLLQSIGAYGCALSIGVFLASSYSGIAAKAIFIAIPVITLKIARLRTRTIGDIVKFPAEVASQSTHVLAERDLDSHSRYIDIVSQAS
ncbi:MAG: hypothetical protein EXQ61_00455 [Ilumatobacteraceae bacterium]|nr:hypothetical protein [Ilumatobacteraceae bacterium]